MTLDDIRVEQHRDQLIIAVAPREGLNVLVSAAGNVAHAEIQAALDDAEKEVRHTRALSCVDGFDRIDEIDPWDAAVAADGGEDPVLEAFEEAANADSLKQARYWNNVARKRYLAAEVAKEGEDQ